MSTPELIALIDAVLGDESKPAGAGPVSPPVPAPFTDPTIWKDDGSE